MSEPRFATPTKPHSRAGEVNHLKTTVAIMGLILGLASPFLLFGLAVLGLSLADVYAQTLGVDTE